MKELEEINNTFKKYDISLWLNWGTLLGVYRDNKLIDNDIDLATINLDRPGYLKAIYNSLCDSFRRQGFDVEKHNLGFNLSKGYFRAGIGFYTVLNNTRVLYQEMLPVNFHGKYFAKKFYYGFMKNNPTNIKYKIFKLLGGYYITHVIPLDLVCPLKQIEFNNMLFDIPNYTEKYLEYLYGVGWKTPNPSFPHFVTDDKLLYYKGTFKKFYVQCPKCFKSFIRTRPEFKKAIENVEVKCPECKFKWNQKVFIKGSVMNNI